MNREIKFRVWDGNKMLPLVGLILNPQLEIVKCLGLHTDEKAIEMQNPILMQYTGLKDKNGVEIYEGDIVEICNGSINGTKWPEPNREVKYILNSGFNLHSFMWDKEGKNHMDSTHYAEVKGNVYQHSELLTN